MNGETESEIQKLSLDYSYHRVGRILNWSQRAVYWSLHWTSHWPSVQIKNTCLSQAQWVGCGQDTKTLRKPKTRKTPGSQLYAFFLMWCQTFFLSFTFPCHNLNFIQMWTWGGLWFPFVLWKVSVLFFKTQDIKGGQGWGGAQWQERGVRE